MQPYFLLNSVTVTTIFVICFQYTQPRVIDLSAAKDYLVRYGYLPRTSNGNKLISIDSAIKSFQKRFGLDVTGHLDQSTIGLMSRRRCGISDEDLSIHQRNGFQLYGIKWEKKTLTYDILSYTNQISKRKVNILLLF